MKQIIKENEDCDAEYFLASWFDINSLPKHNMVISAKGICEIMEAYHRQKPIKMPTDEEITNKANSEFGNGTPNVTVTQLYARKCMRWIKSEILKRNK